MAVTTKLATLIPEKGTARFTATFTDDTGSAATPTAVTWTLTDKIGNVINSREDVTATAGSTVTIVLSGADLAIGSNGRDRILTIEGTYNSDAGSGLPLKTEAHFQLYDLKAVDN